MWNHQSEWAVPDSEQHNTHLQLAVEVRAMELGIAEKIDSKL